MIMSECLVFHKKKKKKFESLSLSLFYIYCFVIFLVYEGRWPSTVARHFRECKVYKYGLDT